MYLLFMDEVKPNKKLNIFSLTGLLVPVNMYASIRSEFYSIFKWITQPETGVINLNLHELHGNNFLPHESDKKKLSVYNDLVGMINKYNLSIYRVGYYRTAKFKNVFKTDSSLYSLCWSSLSNVLEPILEESMIIPIMDGFNEDQVTGISQTSKNTDLIREINQSYVSKKFSHNLIGDVFYADSKYSIFTQLVDVISYLRHINDKHEHGIDLSSFHKSLLEISCKLNIAYEAIIELKIE